MTDGRGLMLSSVTILNVTGTGLNEKSFQALGYCQIIFSFNNYC